MAWRAVDMTKKTVIVTGANAGIGRETARELARSKARVILACRDMEKAKAAADDITASTGNPNVLVKHLDLASLKSVRAFAEDILQTEAHLDVLVNNAGVVPGKERAVTEDGFEMAFSTNHLAHFLLTLLLLPLLKRSIPARVVVVSSLAYLFGRIEFDNLNSEKNYWNLAAYSNSKLANLLFTRELARRLDGTGVTVNALHPGVVLTTPVGHGAPFYFWVLFRTVFRFFVDDTEGASKTSVYLAAAEEVRDVNGGFFARCRQTWVWLKADNIPVAKELWWISEQLVGLTHSGF